MSALTGNFAGLKPYLRKDGMLFINVMDLRVGSNFYLLHIDLACKLREFYSLEDMIIWDRRKDYNNLGPLGYPYKFVLNRVHEYILVFRKFEKRTEQVQRLIQIVEEKLWNLLKEWLNSQGGNLYHFPYGYEVHMSEEVKKFLVNFRDNTSIFIRFVPDYVLGIDYNKKTVYLLEYKSITTPGWKRETITWNIGQAEADAWENYMKLSSIWSKSCSICLL
ncbi:MAG: hypothetical protein ABIM02_06000, partial [candidate division WOR-3 bacterium]